MRELLAGVASGHARSIGRALSFVENGSAADVADLLDGLPTAHRASVIGITGAPGAGKSTLIGRLISRNRSAGKRVGVLAVDPSSPRHGGALLGDRIRYMPLSDDPEVVIRSMASRGSTGGLSLATAGAVRVLAHAGCDPIWIETVGAGQQEGGVTRAADLTVLVLSPGWGDDVQAMKCGVLELADVVAINKADQPGAEALMMNIEGEVRDRGCPVCLVSAADGTGTVELLAAIDAVRTRLDESGESAVRQGARRQFEIFGWASALLEPRLNELALRHAAAPGSSSSIARAILQDLLR